jgi:hypothetical protein
MPTNKKHLRGNWVTAYREEVFAREPIKEKDRRRRAARKRIEELQEKLREPTDLW